MPAPTSSTRCRSPARPKRAGKGVLVVLNDEIHPARDVVKTSTYRVQTFRSLDFGALGHVDGDGAHFYRAPLRAHMPDTAVRRRAISPRLAARRHHLFLCRRRRRAGRGGGRGRRARPRLGRLRAGHPEPGAARAFDARPKPGSSSCSAAAPHRPGRAAPPAARDRHRRRRGFQPAKGPHPADAD